MASLTSVSVGSIKNHSGTSNEGGWWGVLDIDDPALGDVEHGDVVVLRLFGEGEDEFVAGAALRVGGLANWAIYQ